MSEVIVVGGGAAGMMAAIAAADCGHQVTIIEKNEKLGKKLFITGKGRCNITNDSDVENHLNHVISNPKFMYSAFYSFDSSRMIDFSEQEGLAVKTERGNRVFRSLISLPMCCKHCRKHFAEEMLRSDCIRR